MYGWASLIKLDCSNKISGVLVSKLEDYKLCKCVCLYCWAKVIVWTKKPPSRALGVKLLPRIEPILDMGM